MMQMNDKYIYMQITMYIHTLQINISLFSSHPNQQLPHYPPHRVERTPKPTNPEAKPTLMEPAVEIPLVALGA